VFKACAEKDSWGSNMQSARKPMEIRRKSITKGTNRLARSVFKVEGKHHQKAIARNIWSTFPKQQIAESVQPRDFILEGLRYTLGISHALTSGCRSP
jgi:hypothetical protein